MSALAAGFGPFRVGGVVPWPCVLAPANRVSEASEDIGSAVAVWSDKTLCCGLWLTAGYFVGALSARGGGHRGCSRTSV